MRLFTAIELHSDIVENARRLQDRLAEQVGGVSWTDPDQMHITLKFLGDCPDRQLDEIKELVKLCAGEHHPFTLRFQSVGQFPERGQPSVFWAGVDDLSEDGQLQSCFKQLDRTMTQVNVDRERRDFVPHVTLGRVNDKGKLGAYREAMEREQHTVLGEQRVDEILLMESELHPEGAEHIPKLRSSLSPDES